jgi:hypothetical protein
LSGAYPSICSAHRERVEGCPRCYPVGANVRDDIVASGVTLRVYWCPICKLQTNGAWHTFSRPNPLIPQNDVEHDCVRVEVVPS